MRDVLDGAEVHVGVKPDVAWREELAARVVFKDAGAGDVDVDGRVGGVGGGAGGEAGEGG